MSKNDLFDQLQGEAAKSKSHVACVNVTGGTQPECVSTTVAITQITGPVTVKIPVVLAELTVQVNMDSMITLPEPALEIKRIKKRLKVTQCLLLQDTNVLFIKGFVRKNIEYATRGCSNKEGVCGDIRHCTVDVPYSCSTPVVFNGAMPATLNTNTREEFEFFRTTDLPDREFAEKDFLLSGDFSEFNQVSQEFFNELPFCELISARIVEYDELINRVRPHNVNLPFEEREFRQIEEKMVLFITLKILQNQQVLVGNGG
ncbi:MAG: CsxC family protein [Bacillota bacterium]